MVGGEVHALKQLVTNYFTRVPSYVALYDCAKFSRKEIRVVGAQDVVARSTQQIQSYTLFLTYMYTRDDIQQSTRYQYMTYYIGLHLVISNICRVDAKLLEEVQEYDAVPSEAASYGENTFWDKRYAVDEEVSIF